MEQEKKEIENELAVLKKELIECCESIKTCQDRVSRKSLFKEKKDILQDIEDLKSELKAFEKLQSEVDEFDKKESNK